MGQRGNVMKSKNNTIDLLSELSGIHWRSPELSGGMDMTKMENPLRLGSASLSVTAHILLPIHSFCTAHSFPHHAVRVFLFFLFFTCLENHWKAWQEHISVNYK